MYESHLKLGEDRFKDLIQYIKGAYNNYHTLADDEIADQMTSFDMVKSITTADIINLPEENKFETVEDYQRYLDENKIKVKIPKEFKSDLEKIAFEFLENNTAALIDKYVSLYGKTINTDDVRNLFDEVGYNKYNANDFHEPASTLSKILYELYLDKYKSKKNEFSDIVVLMGGPGSGKTSSAKRLIGEDKYDLSDMVLDGVLSTVKAVKEKVNLALEKDFIPNVAYVYCPPEKAWTQVLNRMQHEKRPVPLNMFIQAYHDFPKTLNYIHREYDGKLNYIIVNNSFGTHPSKTFEIKKG